jgi:ABC-2 type transport system permease protein
MSALLALIKKDLQLFRADKTAMLISLVVPILLASMFGMIFGGSGGGAQTAKIHVLVVDEDGSATTREIFTAMQTDSIQPSEAKLADAHEQVRVGSVGVAVVFPKGFGKDAARAMFYGGKPKLMLMIDPSKETEAQIVQGRLMEAVMKVVSRRSFSKESASKSLDDAIRDLRASKPADPQRIEALTGLKGDIARLDTLSSRGNGAGTGGGFSVPFETEIQKIQAPKTDESAGQVGRSFAGMAIQGLLFQAINAAMAVLQDRKRGISKRLKAAPISSRQLFLAKLVSSFLITLLILLAVFVVGFGCFHIRIGGSAVGFALICIATALMASSFGLFVAALGRTEEQSRGMSIMAVLLMCMLGGAWFPSFLLPKAMQVAATVIPVHWAIDGFDAVTWRGLGLWSAMPAIGVLLGFTVAFSLFAALRLRWA